MTLEEAIKHAEEIAEENQRVVDTHVVFDDVTIDMLYCDDTEVIEEHLANYQECAEKHRQLAEWLKDYKRLLEQEPFMNKPCVSHKVCHEDKVKVLDKIRADLHATAELHDDGDYYLREEWIDEYFDKYKVEREDKYEAILKTDMVAMLEEIQKEIEENVLADDPNTLLPFLQARETCVAVIQQKINALKPEREE